MKPIAQPPKIVRLARRIKSEEQLLEILAKEQPQHRLYLFQALGPNLPFKLSEGFDSRKLRDMPVTA